MTDYKEELKTAVTAIHYAFIDLEDLREKILGENGWSNEDDMDPEIGQLIDAISYLNSGWLSQYGNMDKPARKKTIETIIKLLK